jgi:hypothetical protein
VSQRLLKGGAQQFKVRRGGAAIDCNPRKYVIQRFPKLPRIFEHLVSFCIVLSGQACKPRTSFWRYNSGSSTPRRKVGVVAQVVDGSIALTRIDGVHKVQRGTIGHQTETSKPIDVSDHA